MKLSKLLLSIIALGFITSCAVTNNPSDGITSTQTQLGEPSYDSAQTDKEAVSSSSQGKDIETQKMLIGTWVSEEEVLNNKTIKIIWSINADGTTSYTLDMFGGKYPGGNSNWKYSNNVMYESSPSGKVSGSIKFVNYNEFIVTIISHTTDPKGKTRHFYRLVQNEPKSPTTESVSPLTKKAEQKEAVNSSYQGKAIETKKMLVGTWVAEDVLNNKPIKILWSINADGTTSYTFDLFGKKSPGGGGNWKYSNNVLSEITPLFGKTSASIKFINYNEFIATIISSSVDGGAKGKKRHFSRLVQNEPKSPTTESVVPALTKKAEKGDAGAQVNLGIMYAEGNGVTQNDNEAIKWYRKAAKQGNPNAYGMWGWLLLTQGKFDEAQTLIEKAHQLDPQGYTSINFGHTYLLKGDRQTARSYYLKGLFAIQDDVAFEQGPIAAFQLFIKKGWQVKACRSELAWFRSVFKQQKLAQTYAFQAMQHNEQGDFKQALSFAKKAYKKKEFLGERNPYTILSRNNLAVIYQSLGRLSDALPLFEKIYHLNQEVFGEKHFVTVSSLNNLVVIYQDVGRLSDALQLSEKSYRLHQEVFGEKHPDTFLSLNNLANIYEATGRLSDALLLFEKAYRLFQEVLGPKHPNTIVVLRNLAAIYRIVGRFSEALLLSEKGYRISQEVLGPKHRSTIISLNNLALIYRVVGRLSEALPLYQKAYRLFKEVSGANHPFTLGSLVNLAYLYEESGKINKAIKHFEKLVKGVEQLRSGDLSAKNRQALFKQWVPRYFMLSDLYINQSRPIDAFRVTELSKARTLLESLVAKRAAQESGLSKAEQNKLQDYQENLAFFNNQIGKAITANRLNDRVSLETDKNQLIAELNQFERKLKAKYPKYNQLSQVQILSSKKGAKYLPKNAVLISYMVDDNNVLAFTLEKNGKLTAHDLGVIPELEKDLEDYRLGLAPIQDSKRGKNEVRRLCNSTEITRNEVIRYCISKRKQETQALSIKLGKSLLEPLKNFIKDKPHWIISPSGALALIPFESLRLEGEKQPVIAQHQISYVQSLSILAMLQKRDKAYKRIKNRGNLFAMGAPIYQKAGKAFKSTKPSSTDLKIARGLVQKSYDYSRALKQLDLNWPNLPGTLKELSALKNIFRGAAIYKQKQATETKLKSLNKQGVLEKYRYLVFSAHGYLSQEVPALSALVLGQVNNPKGIDGYVTAGEWPGYNLKSDLMVLSACETGLGKVVGGEGIMGLPYALYVAGNKNTVLTLWSISDKITVEFIKSFFSKLKAGVGQVKALTATKREFLKRGGEYAKPVYWAAFVLYGI